MKKILLLTTLLSFMVVGFAYADMVIPADSLPARAKEFIKTNFPDASVMYAERDFNSYEVQLTTGAEVEFYGNGEWKQVKAYQNFPVQILPVAVAESVKKAHPQASIMKAEKTWNGYEIKTSNMMEIYINSDGQIIGQKFDD